MEEEDDREDTDGYVAGRGNVDQDEVDPEDVDREIVGVGSRRNVKG